MKKVDRKSPEKIYREKAGGILRVLTRKKGNRRWNADNWIIYKNAWIKKLKAKSLA